MKLKFFALAILALLGASVPLASVPAEVQAKEATPPKPEDLVGAWIGYWEDGRFTRLDLRANWTGYCAFVAPAESILHKDGVDVYRVTQWTLQRWKFVVNLAPIDTRNGSVYLKGRTDGYDMELEVGGTDGKWKQKVVLYKESRMQASNLETKTRIEQAERN